MLPALIIMWLYVSGGIALYALAPSHERTGALFGFAIVGWPVTVPCRIALGLFDGIRGVIGK